MNMYQHFLQQVPLSRIRHNDLPCYRAEGFGGAPVEAWPMYRFFKHYLEGEREAAELNFARWYEEQLDKYHATPKAKGGMHKGSLYQLIERRCGMPFRQIPEERKREVIRERVRERLSLLEDIRAQGYAPEKTERIDAVRKDGLVYLRGGHHRVAALAALHFTELPGVLVFPNEFLYNLFRFFRNLRHGQI